jgi:hypothetical protein
LLLVEEPVKDSADTALADVLLLAEADFAGSADAVGEAPDGAEPAGLLLVVPPKFPAALALVGALADLAVVLATECEPEGDDASALLLSV